MGAIKGYVQYFGKTVPVTWERESEKFVYNVRKLFVCNERIEIDKRVFDDKMPKTEIVISP